MSRALDWSRARKAPPIDRYYSAIDPAKSAALQVRYARYAAAERRQGRQPLPPVQWIKSRKELAQQRDNP